MVDSQEIDPIAAELIGLHPARVNKPPDIKRRFWENPTTTGRILNPEDKDTSDPSLFVVSESNSSNGDNLITREYFTVGRSESALHITPATSLTINKTKGSFVFLRNSPEIIESLSYDPSSGMTVWIRRAEGQFALTPNPEGSLDTQRVAEEVELRYNPAGELSTPTVTQILKKAEGFTDLKFTNGGPQPTIPLKDDNQRAQIVFKNSGTYATAPSIVFIPGIIDSLFQYHSDRLFKNPAVSRNNFPKDANGNPIDLDMGWRAGSVIQLIGLEIFQGNEAKIQRDTVEQRDYSPPTTTAQETSADENLKHRSAISKLTNLFHRKSA